MGSGDEFRSDESAPGSEGGAEQNPANPKTTKRHASEPMQERDGWRTASYQNVCRIHYLLPERSVMQHMH